MNLKSIAIILSVAAIQPLTGAEAQPTTASVSRLLDLTDIDKAQENLIAQIGALVGAARARVVSDKKVSPEDQEAFIAALTKLQSEVASKVSVERVKELAIPIYQAAFSQSEIDGLIAFYSSPAGVAYKRAMPNVSPQLQNAFKRFLSPFVSQIQSLTPSLASTASHQSASAVPGK